MAEGYRPRVSEIENNYYFDSRAVEELQQMLADGRKQGLDFWICSAYRTMEKQTDLYNNKVGRLQAGGLSYEEAYRQAGTVVAYPGTSEHNLGLAADIVAKDISFWTTSRRTRRRLNGSKKIAGATASFCAIPRTKPRRRGSFSSPGITGMWGRRQPKRLWSRESAWKNIWE